MTRKQVLGVAVVVLSTTMFGVLLTATIPVWATIALIRPSTTNSVTNLVMSRMTREMTKMMFRSQRKAAA